MARPVELRPDDERAGRVDVAAPSSVDTTARPSWKDSAANVAGMTIVPVASM